ncbi:MarR family transcriptional regulator [Streptomyces corchorusii]|uniref:MarR family transcriptional regulator n=2 Tax=Streptomyces TaxID=1883 RepID=A0A101PV32_STRCK|nr:MarR family transcriptional regulator [Streptomyces corchorusii]KUN18229.1 MarR family transcriptional regulator [Streptomyces corchorusii]
MAPSTSAAQTSGEHPFATDLNWLLHRVAAGLGSAQDEVARRHGLGVRDYVVLRTVAEGTPTSQLALGKDLGLDKTTLTAVLDRLEGAGLVVRRPSASDRRTRVCEATESGRDLADRAAKEIALTERELLAALKPQERRLLVTLLRDLAFGPFADAAPVTGSCI